MTLGNRHSPDQGLFWKCLNRGVMYHLIEFSRELTVDLERSPRQPLERLLIQKGTRLRAEVKPSVVETPAGRIEVADLFFADGTATRQVPFASFFFVD